MTSMKLFRLAVLFLIAAALVVGTSAPAVGGNSTVTVLAPTGAEPTASGQATLSNLRTTTWWRQGGASYQAKLKVTCEGLTPHARYEVRTNVFDYDNKVFITWDFQASATGGGAAGGPIKWTSWQSLGVAVFRVDDTPAGTVYTQVLDGYPIY